MIVVRMVLEYHKYVKISTTYGLLKYVKPSIF